MEARWLLMNLDHDQVVFHAHQVLSSMEFEDGAVMAGRTQL